MQREGLSYKLVSTIPTPKLQLDWWQQGLGGYALADITPALLVRYRTTLAEDHANATVHHYFAVLSHACTVAMQECLWSIYSPASRRL
jgi:hypothetical protein